MILLCKKIFCFFLIPFFSLSFLISCGSDGYPEEEDKNNEYLQLQDFDKSSCEKGQFLMWSGSKWVCRHLTFDDTAPVPKSCSYHEVWNGSQWLCFTDQELEHLEAFSSLLATETTPFVRKIKISQRDISAATENITYTIRKKKSGYWAKEISKTYKITDLEHDPWGELVLPVVGLYQGHQNQVDIQIDEPRQDYRVVVETPLGMKTFSQINMKHPIKNEEERPSFDFMLFQSENSGAFILDIDGEARWQFPITERVAWTSFMEKEKLFLFHDDYIYWVDLFGAVLQKKIHSKRFKNLALDHEVTRGKEGYLISARGVRKKDNQFLTASIILEVDDLGNVIRSWEMGEIIAKHMKEMGDPFFEFVREGEDWFHINSVIYTNPEDNSLLVSSRENFVVKLDYDTKEIKWLFGDKTKYWHQFPSLAALALSSDDDLPIGQHSLSLVKGNASQILLFNNGRASRWNPEGTPAGASYPKSRGHIYEIDDSQRRAKMIWEYHTGTYEEGRSSFRRSEDNQFTMFWGAYSNILRVLNANQDVVLEYHLPKKYEGPGLWKAEIIRDVFSY